MSNYNLTDYTIISIYGKMNLATDSVFIFYTDQT